MDAGTDDFRRRLLSLLDAANRALDQHDLCAAADNFAQASEMVFRRVAAVGRLEEKVALTKRGRQLLATAAALRGERAPGDEPAETAPAGGQTQGHRLNTGVTFADIAGLEDVKDTLRLRVIYPMREPEKLARFGLQIGGSMLLFGPPGTGKTMVAKAVAGELELPFFNVAPSEILSQYYGQSEKRLAELFAEVRSYPGGAVVFIDEIDAIGASRSLEGTSEPTRRLLNQLLQELDGVNGRPKGLLFLGATNEPWLLDEALLRPPRFSEKCYLPLPDQAARAQMLRLRLKECPMADDVDIDRLAADTSGYSGADMVNVCERAKLIPYREAVEQGIDRPVSAADFAEAMRRVRPSVSPGSVRKYEEWAEQ